MTAPADLVRQDTPDDDEPARRAAVQHFLRTGEYDPKFPAGGRRMNAGALTLVDHVLPEVPIRQFVLTVPFPLRFPLAFDGKLLGQVLRIFTDTVAANYRKRMEDRGIADGQCGAVTVIQRANSDLRLSPHFHVLQLDGLYAPGRDGGAPIFHPAPGLTQEDVEAIVERASKRILRFLQRRGVITLVTAPGDGEVTVVGDETIGEKDPLLAKLLAAATAGAPPAGPTQKRAPVRIMLDPDDRPVAKGKLCGQHAGFNLHGATRVAANDKQGRVALCKYILRPPLANDRLKILDDGAVRLEFKRPWSGRYHRPMMLYTAACCSRALPASAVLSYLRAVSWPPGAGSPIPGRRPSS